MKQDHERLIGEVMEFLWMENPVEATLAGVHRYDDRLERLDLVSRRTKLRRKKDYADKLRSLERVAAALPELALLRRALESGVALDERLHSLDRDAAAYPRLALYGVYQLVARSTAPYHYRALRAIDRLREIPRVLDEGRLSLSYGERIPRLWTQNGLELALAARQYLAQIIDLLVAEVPELESVVRKYSDAALEAFDSYAAFLREEVLPRADGSFSAGAELFEYLLLHEHCLDLDADGLRELASQESERATAELEALGGTGDSPGWRERVARLESPGPTGDLLAHWKQVILEIRRGLRRSALVTLPPAQGLVLIRTPRFERAAIPVADYIPSPPFEEGSKAFFCITPLPDGAGEEERMLLLGQHSLPRARFTVLRELFPGRHTLLARRNGHGARLSYLSRGSVLEEGWCAYVSLLAVEQGLIDDPELHLLALHSRLVEARRVIADLDLHAAGRDEHRVTAELAQGTGIPELQARLAVRRLSAAPACSVGALVGRLRITELREKCRLVAGKEFSLKRFHDSLLRLSALPLDQLERRLLRSMQQRRK